MLMEDANPSRKAPWLFRPIVGSKILETRRKATEKEESYRRRSMDDEVNERIYL